MAQLKTHGRTDELMDLARYPRKGRMDEGNNR